jgi:hypothetical protein
MGNRKNETQNMTTQSHEFHCNCETWNFAKHSESQFKIKIQKLDLQKTFKKRRDIRKG